MRILSAALLAALCFGPALRAQDDSKAQVDVETRNLTWTVPPDFTMRARVTALAPAEPVNLHWRFGGEGLGGDVTRGVLGENLAVGAWSPAVPVVSLAKGGFPARHYLTFTVDRPAKGRRDAGAAFMGLEVEFEFAFKGKVVRTFKEAGPDGATVGIVIPAYRLAGGRTPESPEFKDEIGGILDYAARRARWLEGLPWAKAPVPRKYAILTDLGGYSPGAGYGIRTSNKAVVEAEARSLRQLGVNGLRAGPAFLQEMIASRAGYAADFARAKIADAGNYPVPAVREGRESPPGAGCPFAPGTDERAQAMAERARELLQIPVEEVWGLTVDEIGAVFDRSPEGKRHPSVCPHCIGGFRDYLKELGLTPAEFGKGSWSDVAPLDLSPPAKAKGKAAPVAPEGPRPWMTDRGAALAAYHTAMFVNHASAKLFTPLRDAFACENTEKAREGGPPRPRLYSYALRGNTFLMGGHSLDFFDFYRHADNGFVYETSNRDARIWGWDSYLCDVGRVVSARENLRFGIYVKPHRGAPVQRALSAAARGCGMIYWYTYGPDYQKGDSFSEHPDALVQVSKAARLLGKSEDVLYGSSWALPAEVAVVNPRSSEIWMRLAGASPAAYENAKWTYTALAHAHVPVDALDEGILARQDLSRYKVVYVSGPNLTRAAAAKLAAWVKEGGTLYTSGGGLARDEANQPLAALEPVLGLQGRTPVELWYRVNAYGGTQIDRFDDPARVVSPVPAGAEVSGGWGKLKPVVGREVLKPAEGAEVLARFADGGAAVTRSAFGKGRAYVVGFYPGLEYSAAVRTEAFDMVRDFDAVRRGFVAAPALESARPGVDASQPLVEGVLLRNDVTGKRAVTLMNWAYRVTARRVVGKKESTVKAAVPFKDLKVTIRGAADAQKATSVWLDQALPVERAGDLLRFTLPSLEEGDVLLLDP